MLRAIIIESQELWYCAPMIIGSFIINDVVPRSIQWLRGGRDKPETVS